MNCLFMSFFPFSDVYKRYKQKITPPNQKIFSWTLQLTYEQRFESNLIKYLLKRFYKGARIVPFLTKKWRVGVL